MQFCSLVRGGEIKAVSRRKQCIERTTKEEEGMIWKLSKERNKTGQQGRRCDREERKWRRVKAMIEDGWKSN